MTMVLGMLLACGHTCGTGTHEDGKECVADDADTAADTETDTAGDTDTGDDTDTGTPSWTVCVSGAPFTTIQSAIDASANGDEILVCAGTYAEVLDFAYHDVSIVGEDAATTIIDGGGTAPVVSVIRGETDARMTGLTLTGGLSDTDPSLLVEGSALTLSDVIVTGNVSTYGNIVEVSDGGSLSVKDSVLEGNGSGSGVLYVTDSTASLVRNRIHDNVTTADITRSQIRFADSTVDFFNNAVWNNDGTELQMDYPTLTTVMNNVFYSSTGAASIRDDAATAAFFGNIVFSTYQAEIYYVGAATFENSDLYAPSSWWSGEDGSTNVGMISQDPRFTDPDAGDFTLESLSPCIDAGNPGSQYLDADGSTNDLGIYGGPLAGM